MTLNEARDAITSKARVEMQDSNGNWHSAMVDQIVSDDLHARDLRGRPMVWVASKWEAMGEVLHYRVTLDELRKVPE